MKSAASWIALSVAALLTACGAGSAGILPVSAAEVRGPAGDYPMVLGEPFIVDGVVYTPADTLNYDTVGYAGSAAGDGISGAHRTLPLPSYVEVTSLETGRTILVRMTQRGPMQGSNLVSLSAQAWAQLGATSASQVPVRVRRVNPPETERALLRSGAPVSARMDTPPGLLAVLKRKLGLAPTVPPLAPAVAGPDAGARTVKPAEAHVNQEPKQPSKPTAVPAVAKVDPKPKVDAKPGPKVAVKPDVKPSPSAGKDLFIQVGAFSSRERASVAAKGVGGTVKQAGKFWSVRTGPHKDRGQADVALAKARAAGYADARVVTAP